MRRRRRATGIASVLAIGAACTSAAGHELVGDDPLLRLCADALLAELLIVVIALGGARLAGPGPGTRRRLGIGVGGGRIGRRGTAWLVLGTLALSYALDAVLSISGLAQDSVLGAFPPLLAGARGGRLLLAVAALGAVPAIAEELLCRGLLQRSLTSRFGPAIGIGGAAALFGMLHLDLVHAAFAGVLGIYLGLAAHWSGNTWAPIACHAANNLAAIGLAAATVSAPGDPAAVVLGFSLAAACAWQARRGPRAGPPPPAALQREPGSDDR